MLRWVPGQYLKVQPIGFAHRGSRSECPDNTIAGFARALELGAGGLESDVWVTSDGVAVLDHDGVLGPRWRRRRVRDCRREELPARIPSLGELYEAVGADFELSLDVKDHSAVDRVVEVAEAAGAGHRVWLCASGPALGHWRRRWPGVRLVESTSIGRDPAAFGRIVAAAVSGGVDAVNLRWPQWAPQRLEEAHGSGLKAFAWDVQTPAQLGAVLASGVDAVYSDHVADMVAALRAYQPGV